MYQAELLAVKCCLETKVPVAQEADSSELYPVFRGSGHESPIPFGLGCQPLSSPLARTGEGSLSRQHSHSHQSRGEWDSEVCEDPGAAPEQITAHLPVLSPFLVTLPASSPHRWVSTHPKARMEFGASHILGTCSATKPHLWLHTATFSTKVPFATMPSFQRWRLEFST